jgi:murein DD-endopeptidase MepM/ murein hydrolase activator NlpD
VDYQNKVGTPALAAAAGQVLVAGKDQDVVYGLKPNFYGNLVVVVLDRQFEGQPVYLLYGHLSDVRVQVGQRVAQGDELGLVGMTGVAIGPHLHLEVRLGANRYENTRNPVLWLKPEPGQGIIAGRVLDARGQPVPEVAVTFFRAAEPAKWWRQTQTYAVREVNADDALGENLALGYVPAGEYLVKVKLGAKSYVQKVTVERGKVAWFELSADK